MFLTISLSVNSLLAGAAGAAGLGVCKRKKRKPIAFVPRMLVKIVTVTPPKGFDYIDSVPAIKTERW
jgi:ABC-type amino acid transport system permease subunit